MDTQLEIAIRHENIKIALRSITPGVFLTMLNYNLGGFDLLNDTLGFFLLWLGMYRLSFYTDQLRAPMFLTVLLIIGSLFNFFQDSVIHHSEPEAVYESIFIRLYFSVGYFWVLLELFTWMARASSKMGVNGVRKMTTAVLFVLCGMDLFAYVIFFYFGEEAIFYLFPPFFALAIGIVFYMDYLKILFGNAVLQETNLEVIKEALDPVLP